MEPQPSWQVDWTAVAAITAIVIWVADLWRRYWERRATERFLSQLLLTPVSVSQLEITKLRAFLAPSSEDQSRIRALLSSQATREEVASRTACVTLELPGAVLDKADVFRSRVSNRMAWALSSISRLNQAAKLIAEVDGKTPADDVEQVVLHFLEQVRETEQAIAEAFEALLKAGKA